MKALSLWQPWATLMAIGAKRIETRSRNMRYRGPLAICATKKWNRDVVETLFDAIKEPDDRPPSDWKRIVHALGAFGYMNLNQLPLGSVLCVVDVVDCVRTEELVPRVSTSKISVSEQAFGDYSLCRYGIVTENLRRLTKPIPVCGRQGLFDIPDIEV